MAISGISANPYYAYAPPAQGGARTREEGAAAQPEKVAGATAGAAPTAAQAAAGLPPGQRVQAGADSQAARNNTGRKAEESGAPQARDEAGKKADAGSARKSDGSAFSEEELAQIAKLQARDREVRQHEMAHLAAAGGLATSGASFSYQKGPDGVNYAIGGEVSIDTSSGSTPQETIQRARTIQAAALAPASPSGADRAVAAAAQQMELQARAELASSAISAPQEDGAETVGATEAAKEAQVKDPAQVARDVAQALAESLPPPVQATTASGNAPQAAQAGVSAPGALSPGQRANAPENTNPFPPQRNSQLARAYGDEAPRQPNLRAIA
ncbi:putative metalloprotease CJM1_0395 family protein [Massilia sp. W12]|uniref:putative metalloprotease CJM1_0395 family protein n=1 Tax=Massilia sp. W12 TaxID=3126507 RepID=UPI0030CAEE2B